MRVVAMAVAIISLLSLSPPLSRAAAAEVTRFDIVVTLVDEDIYVEQSRQVYLRTDRCAHRADQEPAVLALDQEKGEVLLVFHDGDVCRVVNASLDRGGI